MNQFNEITYRKVTTIDAYGEENWDALDKEATLLVEKIGKREGNGDDDIKRWRKSSWAMPEEYKKLSEKQELTVEDLRAMIYEFKENVDQLEVELKKEEGPNKKY